MQALHKKRVSTKSEQGLLTAQNFILLSLQGCILKSQMLRTQRGASRIDHYKSTYYKILLRVNSIPEATERWKKRTTPAVPTFTLAHSTEVLTQMYTIIVFFFFCLGVSFCSFLCFIKTVSLCSSDCPEAHYVDEAGLKLRRSACLCSQALGLKV